LLTLAARHLSRPCPGLCNRASPVLILPAPESPWAHVSYLGGRYEATASWCLSVGVFVDPGKPWPVLADLAPAFALSVAACQGRSQSSWDFLDPSGLQGLILSRIRQPVKAGYWVPRCPSPRHLRYSLGIIVPSWQVAHPGAKEGAYLKTLGRFPRRLSTLATSTWPFVGTSVIKMGLGPTEPDPSRKYCHNSGLSI
jgi:hypothetical protein